MKNSRKYFFKLLVLCLLFFAACPVSASASQKTVKVGIFSLGKFQGWDKKGNPSGYNIDYLNEIAKKTHWKYKYVDCNNWINATKMLEEKKIDLLAPAQITDELSAKFDYATLAMGNESAAIYTRAERSDLLYEDFESMSNLTYGLAEGSTFAKKFMGEYIKDHGMTPKVKYYADTTKLQEAMKKGEVDAIVTNIMFACDGYKLLGWFSPLPVYYITQKNNRGLLAELNNAMIEITVEKPAFQPTLLSSYFPIFDSSHISYSETQYIKKLGRIKVGYLTDEKPMASTDDKGEFTGICREVMDKVAKNLGLSFEYVPLTTKQANTAYLLKNKITLLANYEYTGESMSKIKVQTTQPYINMDEVMVVPEGSSISLNKKITIAVDPATWYMKSEIKERYPNARIVMKKNIAQCFQMVSSGKAQILIGKRYVVDPYLSKPAYGKMQISQVNNLTSQTCIGLFPSVTDNIDNIDSVLLTILDKGINQISDTEINAIVLKEISDNRYQFTMMDFAYQYKYFLFVLGVAVLMIVVLLGIVDANKKRSLEIIKKKNDQLAAAIDSANDANASKSQFLAQMSHEIRTPMNAIIGLATIARTDVNNPAKMKDFLNKLDSSSRLLLGIINDVLDMSAIENKKMKIAKAEFDFKKMLSSLTTVFYQQCKQKNIDFSMRMSGVTEEQLKGDVLRVNQILMNLLSNAVKFTPAGGEVSVLVVQGSQSQNTVHIRFVVSDTGCGMSEDLMKRLFHPFEQEDASTARKHGGSGLGLAISKSLVEMMNGSIQVESKKDVGTVFTVDIPFEKVKQKSRVTKQEFRDIRALIVDDDKESCEYAGILLDRLNVKHNYVTNGEAALENLGEAEESGNPYNLCMVDWKMPDMDGVELTKQIRDIFGNETLVIIVSAYDLNEIEGEGKAAGADYFIPKPLFQSTLFDVLMKISNNEYSPVETEPEKTQQYNFKGKKVLVAEDVVLNMEVAVKLLDLVGIKAVCAEDGVQAVELFKKSKENEYDAVLLDINMPNMDGYEASMEIRASGRADSKSVPIYAMTANAFTEDVTSALNAGMNGHIAKPIETEVLYETLNKAFMERETR